MCTYSVRIHLLVGSTYSTVYCTYVVIVYYHRRVMSLFALLCVDVLTCWTSRVSYLRYEEYTRMSMYDEIDR